jgi:hypothetical protein
MLDHLNLLVSLAIAYLIFLKTGVEIKWKQNILKLY